MTLNQLSRINRELSQPRKLEIIEENLFSAGNKCMETYKATGNIQQLRAGISAYRAVMQSVRDTVRHFNPVSG